MQEIRTKAAERLTTDSYLYPSGLVPGGIYTRPLRPGRVAGATPDAFYVDPLDPAGIQHIRESIVIIGPNDVMAPDGPQSASDRELRNAFLRVFYYVPATNSGKAKLDQIDARVRSRLHNWQAQLSIGTPVTFTALEMTEPLDSDEIAGALVCYRRFVGEYLRPVV